MSLVVGYRIEDIENEIKRQQVLSQPQEMKLDQLAAKALRDSMNGRTKEMGFDEHEVRIN